MDRLPQMHIVADLNNEKDSVRQSHANVLVWVSVFLQVFMQLAT